MRTLAVGSVIVLAACGPSVGAGDGGGSGGGSSTGAGGSGGGVSTGVADGTGESSGTGTSAEAESSSGGESTGNDESTGEVPSVCNPQPEDVVAGVFIDADIEFPESIVVDDTCSIESIDVVDAQTSRVAMSCSGTAHTIDVVAAPPFVVPLTVGSTVHLRASRETFIDSPAREHVAVHTLDEQLVLGMYGTVHLPSSGVDVLQWFAPFELQLDTSQCDPEPFEPPSSGGFISDPCPNQIERAAFMVRSPWAIGLVYDDTAAPFGDYQVVVPWAQTLMPQDVDGLCREFPHPIGRVVFLPD